MKKIFNLFLLLNFMHVQTSVFAQSTDAEVMGLENENSNLNFLPLPFPPVRDADLFWQKRLVREIDINEKINLPFKYAKLPLIRVIQEAVCLGDLVVYDADTEMFAKSIVKENACKIGSSMTSMEMIDPITLLPSIVEIKSPLAENTVIKYRLVEDWYFSEKTGTMKVFILAILPIREVFSSEGIFIGYSPMYWVNYGQVRDLLANTKAFNIKNDERFLNWDDVLQERVFSSRVIYESNIFDRNIADYATSVDALLEINRIEQEILVQDHDAWTY